MNEIQGPFERMVLGADELPYCVASEERRKEMAERIKFIELWDLYDRKTGRLICRIRVNGVDWVKDDDRMYTSRISPDGWAFAAFLYAYFEEELKKLNSEKFFGLSFYGGSPKYHKYYIPGDTINLDGACGSWNMRRILYAIGFFLEETSEWGGVTTYKFHARQMQQKGEK